MSTADTFLAAVRAEQDGGDPTTVGWLIGTARHGTSSSTTGAGSSASSAASDCSTAASSTAKTPGTTSSTACGCNRSSRDCPPATEALLVRARTAFRRQHESTEQPGGAP